MGSRSDSFNDKTTVKDNISNDGRNILGLDMKMKSGGQISDKIILVKRKKLRNVKLKVDSNKFGVKTRRSSLERCLICDHDAVQVDTSAGLLGA